MKITKSIDKNVFIMGAPDERAFDLIKKLAPSDDLKTEDLFVYRVVLCDNRVDRDLEMFSHSALVDGASKFNGVIGIEDHTNSVKYNHSRIYDTEIVVYPDEKNDFGEPYECLVAYAYTLNNDKNKQLIDEIKSGIKKEVSIGFSSSNRVCSICGCSNYSCDHIRGKEYAPEGSDEQKLCVGIINSIDDAYEWSFVSVPAQRGAGVTKSFTLSKEESTMDFKSLAQEIAKGLDAEMSIKFLKAVDEVLKPESEIVKSLQTKIAGLEADIVSKDAEIKSMKEAETERVIEDALDEIFETLVPKNDTMRELACKVIEGMITVDDEGKACGKEAAVETLSAEEYKPLFSETKPDDAGAGKSKKEEDPDPAGTTSKGSDATVTEDGVKNYSYKGAVDVTKSIDFSRVSKFNPGETKRITVKPGMSNVD